MFTRPMPWLRRVALSLFCAWPIWCFSDDQLPELPQLIATDAALGHAVFSLDGELLLVARDDNLGVQWRLERVTASTVQLRRILQPSQRFVLSLSPSVAPILIDDHSPPAEPVAALHMQRVKAVVTNADGDQATPKAANQETPQP